MKKEVFKMKKKPKYSLKLYVSKKVFSISIIEALKKALEGTDYRIIIIDIEKHPEEAERDNVLVTPTLIKELPPPLRRVVGEMLDGEKVLAGLDII